MNTRAPPPKPDTSAACPACNGTGYRPDAAPPQPCPACHGVGWLPDRRGPGPDDAA